MNSDQNAFGGKYFDADRPVEHRQQDRLGRRSFAEAIARQVRVIPAEHGFTIAVMGEWGSGKTSVLNMVAETLEEEEDATAVLRFNPWLFGGANDLVTLFFRELGAQLGQDRFDRLKGVAKALAELGQVLVPKSPIVRLAAKLTDRWTEQPSLHDKRQKLREALAASDSRVVVLIDDIDRLEDSETRDLMRLVRLTSDLPNVVFLLAFDSRHVARSLGENEMEGQRYLDKIVQVSYDLPNIHETILPGMFFSWLEELIRGRDFAQLDSEVWARAFYDVIKPLLGNLRDVKRYLYSIPVTLDTVGQEVALADLFSLEAVRILRPSMFNDLRAHAEYLVHPGSGSQLWLNAEARDRETEEILSAMLERAGDERVILSSVLAILFPATQGFLGRSSYGQNWIASWRRQRRVACEEVLHIYLQAGLDEGTIPSREVQELVEALTDEEKLTSLLDALDGQKFEAALER
ncbi:MAG: AAA family ATPase, partial [Caldilineaceae bacterium SB0668_bin_21]|nr:AAA family ATPase [Caldilineaceae bacterium SB0668_bin_21]